MTIKIITNRHIRRTPSSQILNFGQILTHFCEKNGSFIKFLVFTKIKIKLLHHLHEKIMHRNRCGASKTYVDLLINQTIFIL
jgi:hypothetical protein